MFCYFCVFSFDFLVFFFNDCSSLAFLTCEIWRLVHSVTCIYRIIMQVILNLIFSIVWCKVLWPSIIYLIDNGKICLRKVSMLFWSTFVLTGRGFPILESECPHFLDCWCGDEGHAGPPGAMCMPMVVHSPGSAPKFGQILRFSCLQGLWGDTWVTSIAEPHRNLFLFRINLKR